MKAVGTGLKTENGVFVHHSNREGTKARRLSQRRLGPRSDLTFQPHPYGGPVRKVAGGWKLKRMQLCFPPETHSATLLENAQENRIPPANH